MKLQFVCQHFYPENYPLSKICTDLAADDNQVKILTGLPNYPEGTIYKGYRFFHKRTRHETIKDVDVIRCGLIARGHSKVRLFLNYLSFAITSSIKALFIKKDFDAIIVIQTSPITMVFPAAILKTISKKPLYIYTFDLWPESLAAGGVTNKNIVYKVSLGLSKYLYNKADKIFTSSKRFSRYFENVLDIKQNIYYLPFYDSNVFLGIKPKQSDGETTNLVFAGNIGKMQNVECIMLAANELSNVRVMFHIVGEGSSKTECETLAERLNLQNIKFYGKLPASKMPEIYEMADAMLISLADNKLISYTLPNKVLSCTASARPIISIANGETTDIIHEANCGFTCAAGDHLGLKQAILDFIDYPYKQQLGENARTYFLSHFTKEIFLNRLYGYIDKEKYESTIDQ